MSLAFSFSYSSFSLRSVYCLFLRSIVSRVTFLRSFCITSAWTRVLRIYAFLSRITCWSSAAWRSRSTERRRSFSIFTWSKVDAKSMKLSSICLNKDYAFTYRHHLHFYFLFLLLNTGLVGFDSGKSLLIFHFDLCLSSLLYLKHLLWLVFKYLL